MSLCYIYLSSVIPLSVTSLFSVSNFRDINPKPTNTPIIGRQVISYNYLKDLFPNAIRNFAQHVPFYEYENAQSEFFVQSYEWLKLHLLKFIAKIRPWNYEFNVYHYSSKSSLRSFDLSSMWVNQYNTSNPIPPTPVKIRLVIFERSISETQMQSHRFRLADPKRHQEMEIIITIEYLQLNAKKLTYKIYIPCSYCNGYLLESTHLESMKLHGFFKEISLRLLKLENTTIAYLSVDSDLSSSRKYTTKFTESP